MGEEVIYEAIGNKTPRVALKPARLIMRILFRENDMNTQTTSQMILISKAWKWIMSTSEKP